MIFCFGKCGALLTLWPLSSEKKDLPLPESESSAPALRVNIGPVRRREPVMEIVRFSACRGLQTDEAGTQHSPGGGCD